MEHQPPTSSGDEIVQNESLSAQPGAESVEALMRVIAQEFVMAFDEFNERVLDEDESDERPRVQAAGS